MNYQRNVTRCFRFACPAFHHLYAAAFRRAVHELVKGLEICARFTVSKELRRLQS